MGCGLQYAYMHVDSARTEAMHLWQCSGLDHLDWHYGGIIVIKWIIVRTT